MTEVVVMTEVFIHKMITHSESANRKKISPKANIKREREREGEREERKMKINNK